MANAAWRASPASGTEVLALLAWSMLGHAVLTQCGAGSSPSEAGQIGTNASGPNLSRQRGDKNEFDLHVDRSKEATLIVTLIRTSESPDHGILEVDWERRQVAVTHLVRIADNKYVIASQDGYTETKAPLGAWNVKDGGLYT